MQVRFKGGARIEDLIMYVQARHIKRFEILDFNSQGPSRGDDFILMSFEQEKPHVSQEVV